MKYGALAVAVVLSSLAHSAPPNSMGTLTNKVPDKPATLNVVDAVAVFEAEHMRLAIHLMSRHPDADDLAYLQTQVRPAADGLLSLDWNLERDSFGDTKKAFVYIWTGWDGNASLPVNFNEWGHKVNLSISGPPKVGQEITVKTKGSDKQADWDLNIRTKVYRLKTK